MIPLLLKLKNGKHEGKRRVHKFRSNHIELELDQEIVFNVDGEKLEGKKFIIDLLPKELNVYNNPDFVNEIINGKIKKEIKV